MKLFILLSRVPYPLDKGDRLRAFNQIKQLSKKNQIILFALNDTTLHKDALVELKKYCIAIYIVPFSKYTAFKNLIRTIFTKLPFQVGYFYFERAQKRVDDIIQKHKPEHIYCQLIRTSEYVKNYPSIRKTIDYMDVFSKGMERRIKKESFFLKPFLFMEFKRLLFYEKDVFRFFANKVIISEQDRYFIPHANNNEIVVIPNGVDTNFFKPIASEKEFELLFNGNMNYPPNIESVEFLVNKVLPLVLEDLPKVKLLISGTNPSKRILKLRSSNVFVSGWVDDIRENFAKSKILVAPMQISIGLQNKLLEAMAMKIPCVTTSLANNALKAEVNKEILVANSPEEIAAAIKKLLKSNSLSEFIANNGFDYVVANFNWEKTTNRLEECFK